MSCPSKRNTKMNTDKSSFDYVTKVELSIKNEPKEKMSLKKKCSLNDLKNLKIEFKKNLSNENS